MAADLSGLQERGTPRPRRTVKFGLSHAAASGHGSRPLRTGEAVDGGPPPAAQGRGLGQRPKLQLPHTEKAGSLFSAIPAPAPSGEQGEQEQYQWGGSLLERDTRERLGGCGHSLEFCFHRCAFPQLRVHQLSFWNLELEDGVVVAAAAVHKPRSPLVCLKSRRLGAWTDGSS